MKPLIVLLTLASCIAGSAHTFGANPQYKGMKLFTAQGGQALPLFSQITNGQAVGSLGVAVAWEGPSGDAVNLHPTNLIEFAYSSAIATDGNRQVGRGSISGYVSHALLWSGSADSAVDLHPSSFHASEAWGISGTEQVGIGLPYGGLYGLQPHALLWKGTAESAIDLNPTPLGFESSRAYGTDGTYQVGGGQFPGASHALLWNGSPESAIDLHPAHLDEILGSTALSVSGTEQVGRGYVASEFFLTHALLWNGSAESAVDLHPIQLSHFLGSSVALATNGRQQVGWVRDHDGPIGAIQHAMLWYGTADSAVDLHLLLPGDYQISEASSIDADGRIYGFAYGSDGTRDAVIWVPVPEPYSGLLIALAVAAILPSVRCRTIVRSRSILCHK